MTSYDRPVFFFELRDRYVCSWCELHGSQLILVPTAHSRGQASISAIQMTPPSSDESRPWQCVLRKRAIARQREFR